MSELQDVLTALSGRELKRVADRCGVDTTTLADYAHGERNGLAGWIVRRLHDEFATESCNAAR